MEGATVALTDSITSGSETFLQMTTNVIDFITQNPLLVLLLVGGTIVPLGIAIFRKVKRAAK